MRTTMNDGDRPHYTLTYPNILLPFSLPRVPRCGHRGPYSSSSTSMLLHRSESYPANLLAQPLISHLDIREYDPTAKNAISPRTVA